MNTTPPPPTPFDGFVCYSVYAAGLAFNRLYKRLLDRFGLTYPQYLVLVALGQRDGLTVGELGDALWLDSNTLTPMLKRMEAAGLVTRRRDTDDQRVVRIALTAKGADVTRDLACVPPDVGAAAGLSAGDLRHLQDMLRTLTDNVRTAE